MPLRLLPALILALPLLLVGAPAAVAGPVDVKVGETRVAYHSQGTKLRATKSKLGQVVVVLPKGTHVRVLAVELPWVQVQSGSGTGYVIAREIVVAGAMSNRPAPTFRTDGGRGGKVSQKDVAIAGRQFDNATETRYRTSRKDLQRGYTLTNQMEAMTQTLDPSGAVEFIVDGSLGRQGRDYALPARLPRTTRKITRRRKSGNPLAKKAAGGLGKFLGGKIGKKLGGSTGSKIGRRLGEGLAEGLADLGAHYDQLAKSFTPEQQYYLGRAVAAKALAQYGVDPDTNRRMYVKRLGDAIVRLSNRVPANFGGYHFEVLNSDEINGVSGPGGFVLVTRGAVMACQTEDELAGILCHELGHIIRSHAEKILRKGKTMSQHRKNMGNILAKAAGVGDVALAAGLTNWFGASADNMYATATNTGYGRQLEFDADLEGTYNLFEAYYNHMALHDVLMRMAQGGRGGHHHGGTHAAPQARAQYIAQMTAKFRPFAPRDGVNAARQARLNSNSGR